MGEGGGTWQSRRLPTVEGEMNGVGAVWTGDRTTRTEDGLAGDKATSRSIDDVTLCISGLADAINRPIGYGRCELPSNHSM